MASFKGFEEIEVWQRARALCDKIYKATAQGTFANDYKLKDQINGSSGSIRDNIAEGYERDGTREFIQFLSIAKSSGGETRSQLYRALDRQHIDQSTHELLSTEVAQISKQLSNFILYLNSSGIKGTKFIREPEERYLKTGTNPNPEI